ncbi:magnesium transporter [Aristaeella hokkaidonensis]|uniref:Magnesium transporter n=1 Tax=Aristaeella hokkaidonensis TaxID=3046382 RepID=A0AC61N827_9FIRM|nr:magnesium transporter [Aristaeella hokkaidonensis]QUC67428.1 magnesium transporter [Aristaeella hokkaidonensis]SNT92460.1 magnesium transporter [Aristaeella hokkaidonensis]
MAEHSVTVENTLQTLLTDKKYSTIRDILVTMNPADIAAVFAGVESDKLPLLFRLLPKELAAESFVEMESEEQESLIKGISDKELRQVMDELYVDDAVDIVEEMPANVVQRILAQADPEMRKEINEILQYPEDSAGSVMTTEYVKLTPDMTVGDAILRIRRTGVDKETIYTCYVLQNRLLVGTVSVKSLLLAPSDLQTIDSIMESNLITVTTHTDQEEVARMMSKYNLLAIPVVDGDNRMVGIVTFDDAMDVVEEETTEDMEIMAGMTPSDKTYLRSSPFDLFLHRIPWLSLLMISATFTGMIISNFEKALAAMTCLAAFIPMLMDTGGNSGSQSSVTVIRALSLGELEFSDLGKVIWKEIRTALICGACLSVLCFAKVMLVDRLIMGNDEVSIMVAVVVGLTLAVTVLCAKLVGCTLPMLAKKLGFDPAVMASPFITTIVDALSLLVYFGIATALLKL